MSVSVFDLFKIGIGPSSSHTVGPMRAALMFVRAIESDGRLEAVSRIRAELYGSLGATGKGHGTDKGVMLGLMGQAPDTIDADEIDSMLGEIYASGELRLAGVKRIPFSSKRDIVFYRQALPEHPNGMKLFAFDGDGAVVRQGVYLSVGGGFVVTAESENDGVFAVPGEVPYPFSNSKQLLELCEQHGKSIAELTYANERVSRSEAEIHRELRRIWFVMQACVERGCRTEGSLPGPLGVKRRAASLHRKLTERARSDGDVSLAAMDWLNLYALAVNEENAGGGRVVTAPTNGAAGIIPAVLHYYMQFVPGANLQGVFDFLLTGAAIGMLYKLNASISGAEVGCQGEVGVACSMAAGGLCALLGGTPKQVEHAAEIGMEHNLGLTCDPFGGMVQIPCIERNAMGAVKAVNAARMAMDGDGTHYVSLDSVIKTMRQTGADMKTKYKETSRGGLAVNIIEC
ncbi:MULTISPECIES: L-serine ammonia-lyase [Burkholderia]|uniref:L-serine ammonia-lyase n=1 Tax=Burkholderia TaxID=32008 RepID=UPI000B7AEACD|nr:MULTISPECIES: L-serine ammonia-lyase [Burkholderia]OXJ00419.1 L-serine ammonia-lyase [Burkholderia sp. AU33803]PRD94795.1 L-serine ammonia-lyase [Burkholderia contaminans]